MDWHSASSCCSMFESAQEAVKQAMPKLCLWTVISRKWQLAKGQRASQEWYTDFVVVVCLGKRKLKNKHTQPANKTKEAFAFPNVLLLRASAARYSWTGISCPPLWGKNSPCCSLVVSGLWIFVFILSLLGWLDWLFCVWEDSFEQSKHTLMTGLKIK